MKAKIKAHLWTLGRFFAVPFFGVTLLCGVTIANGSLGSLNTWLAFITATLIMAGGHSFNTLLDTVWTRLDSGEETSVSKGYAAGCNVITGGILSPREVLANALGWYVLSLIPLIMLTVRVTPLILVPAILGMGVTFWYSKSKFTTWSHELALASGPVAACVMGALSTGTGEWVNAFLVALPIVTIFSFAGLALDEHPDAEANLKKGVRSLPYKIWEYGFDLPTYLLFWIVAAYCVQGFLVAANILAPLTGITFILLPPTFGLLVYLKGALGDPERFKSIALKFVMILALYPVLLLVGQAIEG